jgi:hypothetical protein
MVLDARLKCVFVPINLRRDERREHKRRVIVNDKVKSLHRTLRVASVILVLSVLGPGSIPIGFADKGLSFTTIDVPGAVATPALGINAQEDIVGFYELGSIIREYKTNHRNQSRSRVLAADRRDERLR